MYGVFKKLRLLKLIGLALGLVLTSYLLYGAVNTFKSRGLTIDDLVGFYAYGAAHQVDIKSANSGRLVSGEENLAFTYTYNQGTFFCASEGGRSWRIKVITSTSLYNAYDHTYHFKQGVAQ